MADKDIGQGWGDLPGTLAAWFCPKCHKEHPVAQWAVVMSTSGVKMDGRKCPACDFSAFQHNDTVKMNPANKPTPKVKVKH